MILAETINVDGVTALVVAIGAALATLLQIAHVVVSYLGRQKQDAKTDAILLQNDALQKQNDNGASTPSTPLPPPAQAIVEAVKEKAASQTALIPKISPELEAALKAKWEAEKKVGP